MGSNHAAAEWYRSALPLLLLHELSRCSAHGYGLIEALRHLGFETKGATVYPHLAKLQHDGWVTADWHTPVSGPPRKMLTITAAGRERLDQLHDQWGQFRILMDTALSATPTSIEGEKA
ncbi:MAG: PadR family transcriptional regulator [Propionibacteriales bacterium]|nr:PadR family transcriptional regulator [Propionibacteriales bacterium]